MPADVSPTALPEKKGRRRWLRYSLRTLLLVMLLCALGASWAGYHIQKGRDQLAAIAWVEGQGGEVEYLACSFMWQWQWLGTWYPEPVLSVDLSSTQFTDLSRLAPLENLTAVRLCDSLIIDLSPLGTCEQLLFLDLTSAIVQEDEVTRLRQELPELVIWQPPTEPRPERDLREIQSRLQVIDSLGVVLWDETDYSEESGNFFWMGDARSDTHLFFSTFTTLRAYDTTTDQVAWQKEMLIYPLQCVEGTLFGVDWSGSTYDGVLAGFDAATGEEFLQMDLGGRTRQVDLRAIECLLLVNLTSEGEPVSQVLEPTGEVRARFDKHCNDLLVQGDNLICQFGDCVQCIAPGEEILWSVPLDQPGQLTDGLQLHPNGDLIVLNYQAHNLTVVEILRLDPKSGAIRRSILSNQLDTGGSVAPAYLGWTLHVVQAGSTLAIIGEQTRQGRCECLMLFEADTGMPLYYGSFSDREAP